jgi:anti-sigma regulatory factor (Ser/Thr protein kinase)
MSSAADPDIRASTPPLARLSAIPAPGEQQHLGLRPAPQDQRKTRSSNGAARPLSDPPADAEMLRYRADLARVRSFAAAWAARAGLPPHRVGDLVIAVGELIANTLAHTNEPGQLTLWTTGSEVICQVHDIGEITDPLAGKLRPDPDDPGGGRGLWVVHQLCDLVEIRTGSAGTTTRMHLQLRAADHHPEQNLYPAFYRLCGAACCG